MRLLDRAVPCDTLTHGGDYSYSGALHHTDLGQALVNGFQVLPFRVVRREPALPVVRCERALRRTLVALG
ncbi:hypothetical protein [Streptomyces aureoversilis]|uniref:Uncharacterized protein n=1 Tax=Streptomyces aureoversilis TaxID=67277 RepID=A0ABV9ZSW9_9ACTN